jgi:hypothetical protein
MMMMMMILMSSSAADIDTDTDTSSSSTSAGVQTHFGDISFAGGMSYDSQRQIVYVTGQVGANSCFVGVLKRVEAAAENNNNNNNQEEIHHPTHLEFLSKQVFNDEPAICQTISYRKDIDDVSSRPGNALVLSISEGPGGLLTDQREEGSRKSIQYGGLIDVQYNTDGQTSSYYPDRSVLMYQTSPITIPRSITNDPIRTNRVFIATMTSESESTNSKYRNTLSGSSPHHNNNNNSNAGNNAGNIIDDNNGGSSITSQEPPNLTPGGGLLKYGNNFSMTIESIRLATEFSSAEPQWRKPFGIIREVTTASTTTSKSSSGGVTVNQIMCRQQQDDNDDDNKKNHALYVVGSTLGSGPAFGVPEFDNDTGHNVIAGFITKLDSDTGDLVSSRRFVLNPKQYSNENEDNNELPLEDTYIEAVCEGTNNEDSIYIVGSYSRMVNDDDSSRRRRQQEEAVETQIPAPTFAPTLTFLPTLGDTFVPTFAPTFTFLPTLGDAIDDNDDGVKRQSIDTPFVAKLKASTLETIWQKTFESTTDARLLGCGVDPESNDGMFVAGIVENGGKLVGHTTSLLGDDVVLIRLRTSDGTVPWAKQLGTSGNDRLAYGGSGLVVLGGEKGVLLMGDTTNHLYSVSEQEKEIFVVEVDAHGNFPTTTETTGINDSAMSSLVKLSSPVKVDGKTDGMSEGDGNDNNNNIDQTTPDDKPIGSGTTTEGSNSNSTITAERGHMFYLLISIGLVAAVASSGFYFISSRKKEKEATERALVFSYLQNFDLEDIDVKQAATGGWHGTYIGSLANGVNVRGGEEGKFVDSDDDDDIDEITKRRLSNMSHSSLVKDILFMDYENPVSSNRNSSNSNESGDSFKNPGNDRDENEDKQNISPWGNEII